MPRKFLGERIDRNTDFQRPSSLTLTPDDLKYIPDFNIDDEESVLPTAKNGKRLSRRFGGTMNLKQRLESVPELFLHDFKKRNTKSNKRVPPPVVNGLKTYNGLPRSKPMRTITEIPPLPKQVVKDNESHEQFFFEKAPIKQRAVTEVALKEDLTDMIDNIYLEPLIMPVRVDNHLMIPIEELQKYGKSDSEILFDEIISAYDSKAGKHNNVLNSEIVSVLDHVKGKQTLMVPKIVSAEAEEEKKRLSINSIGSPLLEPQSSTKLIPILNSPRYSTGSSISCSGDEFSDIVSSNQNSQVDSHEDDYLTALDSIPSLASVDDLDIAEQKIDLSPSSTNVIPQVENTVERVHVKTVTIKPQLFMDWEEDDPIDDLNRRIDNIEIKSIYSDSSSIYSEHV